MASSIKLKTIAELAKVSISAVSRVLSSKGYVSPEVREKVLNALATLTAQDTSGQVRQPQSGLRVALLVHRDEVVDRDPTTSVDWNTFIKAMERRGHTVTFYDFCEATDLAALTAAVETGRLDAAIVNDDFTDDRCANFLDVRRVPWIYANGLNPNRTCHFVDYDNFTGARAAAEHLLDAGHRRIGYITGYQGRWVSENRLEACRAAYAQRGLVWNDELVEAGGFTLNGGFLACNSLLERSPDITALFAFNDLSAIGAIRALRDRNLRVPQDVSVVGFDDMEIAAFSDPPLTTVSRFHPDLNHFLVQTLEDVVAYPSVVSVRVLSETRLVVRQSTQKIV